MIVLVMLLFSSIVYAQNNSIFEKYSEMKNVSSVYISKTMLEMNPNLYTNDVYIGKVAGQLEAVYIVSSMNGDIKNNMRKDIDSYIKKGNYELLMQQKGIVSSSSFYIKKKGDKIRELVMITDTPGKLNFVQLTGDLTLQDIQRITNQASNTASYDINIPMPDMDKLHQKLNKIHDELSKKLNNMDLSYLNDIGL